MGKHSDNSDDDGHRPGYPIDLEDAKRAAESSEENKEKEDEH